MYYIGVHRRTNLISGKVNIPMKDYSQHVKLEGQPLIVATVISDIWKIEPSRNTVSVMLPYLAGGE